MHRRAILPFLIFLLLSPSPAQKKSAVEILNKVEQTLEGLKDYVVDLEANVDMERVRMPKMQATMYFKSPDKVHFESSSFAILPREGFGLPVSVLADKYDPIFKGEEDIGGRKTVRLLLVAKEQSVRLQQLHVWVDVSNYTIVRSESIPYQGRSVRLEFAYALQGRQFWLPVRLRAEFQNLQADTGSRSIDIAVKPELQELRRPPRTGSIEIVYANYRINTGLSDKVFSRKEPSQREKKE